jgi:hypothetical protein
VTVTVRTTHLEVWITPAPTEEVPDPEPVLDTTAFAAVCAFGFDLRYAEATVRRTGGGTIGIGYWSPIEIRMGTFPGYNLPEDGVPSRFVGFIVPIDNALYPIENILHCRGRLYRAAWVRNQTAGGTRMADPDTGTPDEAQVKAVLTACGVPYVDTNVGGTGKPLGLHTVDGAQGLAPNPFHWQEGQSGLDYIDQLDAVSVHDVTALGCYRTVESLEGVVFRAPFATAPSAFVDAEFTEGVDVLEARIARDPAGSANRVTVTGGPDPANAALMPGDPTDISVAFTATATFTVTSGFAPYLPPGLPNDPGTVSEDFPEGFPVVATSFSSPMLEKSLRDDPNVPEDVLSCQAVADYLLGEVNTVVDRLDFSTPRDDRIGPGGTIHLHSPRLGLTDPTRHYWVQHLEVEVDERGVFTQRLRCVRKS